MLNKYMRKYLFFSFFLSILIFPFFAQALTCNVRANSCLTGETCLFSMYQLNNSHVATCDYYTYKVCCDEISAAIKSSCNANEEGEALSFFKLNNSHAAQAGHYVNKLCLKYPHYPVECALRDSCYENETCVVSLYSNINSHVATCDYYSKKLCCRKLPDLFVNSSSINPNVSQPIFGEPVLLNITVWNIGDAAAPNVNVSCYENGTLFDSKIIPSVPPNPAFAEPRYTSCTWIASCKNNISIKVDPANEIKELNETNNEAWKIIPIIEKLNITIISPQEGQSFYRGQTIWLNSTTTSSCTIPSGYTVKWYNESSFIGSGENITWTIPLDDALLGTKRINATVEKAGYMNDSDSVNITILNNIPQLTTPAYNVTPAEVESGDGIQISCYVTDVEDDEEIKAGNIPVNISIKYSDGNWNNATALHIPNSNTFYRDFSVPYSPLGNYIAVCAVKDTDNGYNESSSTFLVWQNGTIAADLNTTEVWWNDPILINGTAKRKDKTVVSSANVEVLLAGKNVCPLAATNANGYYSCTFNAPQTVGIYEVLVKVTDPQTNKIFTNTTSFLVKPSYGGTKEEEETAKRVGCYEVPKIIQNPDGSIKRVIVRVCVWR
jgi:hypothetical protein